LILIEVDIFEFDLTDGREIELGHGRHEVLVLVSARLVRQLDNLEDWAVETLAAVVALGFAHSVVKGVLDIR
jgi:hypothetical protein